MSLFQKKSPPTDEESGELVEKRGFGLWFQIVTERFSPLFRVNLVTVLWLVPFFTSLGLFLRSWDAFSALLCALSFLLASPGICAMNYVCMKIVRRVPVWWWEDYKSSVKREWKRAVPFSLIVVVPAFAYAFSLHGASAELSLVQLVLYTALAFFLIGFAAFGFQQLACVELSFPNTLKNAVLLILAGGVRSLVAVLFAFVCVAAALIFYTVTPFVLLLGLFSVAVMSFDLIFLPAFENFFSEDKNG